VTNPLITGAFAAAMAAAGIKPRRPREISVYAVAAHRAASRAAETGSRQHAAEEKRKRKAAKLEAAAARGGIRRAL
jgi:hypothetical protein